jgi:hypothetical protein
MDVTDAIRAHSRNSNTPIARQVATAARTSSEEPPAAAIPAIATETGSAESPPVIPMTATKKKTQEPRARIAAPKNVMTAMIVTPVGRFKRLPFLEQFASNEKQCQTASFKLAEAVRRSNLAFNETPALIVIWMTVAPVPVIVLLFVAFFVVRAILRVVFRQIASVGVVFIGIPVVVVMVARIVDSDLNAFLRCCSGHDGSACREGSR